MKSIATILRYRCQSIIALLAAFFLSSCQLFNNDVTWQYTVPDGYVGWLAIQYDCPGGQPLDRKGDVIKVMFNSDGLFCTTDSAFAWEGQQTAKNMSGTIIPVYLTSVRSAYGICCLQGYTSRITTNNRAIEVTLDVMWVGSIPKGSTDVRLPIDSIHNNMLAGSLMPAEW